MKNMVFTSPLVAHYKTYLQLYIVWESVFISLLLSLYQLVKTAIEEDVDGLPSEIRVSFVQCLFGLHHTRIFPSPTPQPNCLSPSLTCMIPGRHSPALLCVDGLYQEGED